MILCPWDNPIPFTRAWCLFELYCTIATHSKFDVAMSSSEELNFVEMITKDREEYFKMISHIDVCKSESWNPEDRRRIFEVVEKSVGFDGVNKMIVGKMQTWVIDILKSHLVSSNTVNASEPISQETMINRRMALGDLYELQGSYPEALVHYEECLKSYISLKGTDSVAVSDVYNNMGIVYQTQGDTENAKKYLDLYKKDM